MNTNEGNSNTQSNRTMKIALVIIAVMIALGTAIVVFADDIVKRVKPEIGLMKVFSGAALDYLQLYESTQWLYDMMDKDINRKTEISLKNLESDMVSVDPNMLSVLQLMTLKNEWLHNRTANEIKTNTGLYMAGSNVANLSIHLTEQSIDINIPELFEYFIQIDPGYLSEQINNSIISSATGETFNFLLTDEEMYELYKQLFMRFGKLTFTGIVEHAGILSNGLECKYIAAEDFETYNGVKKVDVYSITLKKESLNEYFELIANENKELLEKNPDSVLGRIYKEANEDDYGNYEIEEIKVENDLLVKIFVYNKALAGIQTSLVMDDGDIADISVKLLGRENIFDSSNIQIEAESSKIEIKSEQQMDKDSKDINAAKLYVSADYTEGAETQKFLFNMDWDENAASVNNLKMEMKLSEQGQPQEVYANIEVSGKLDLDKEKSSILMDFRDVNVDLGTSDIGEAKLEFALKYQWSPLEEKDWTTDNKSVKKLTELSEMDLGIMYLTAISNPIFAQILGGE